jgi:site-specific DNA-methyltransferase (adenine-specific)
MERMFKEAGSDVFIRYNEAVSIYRKVQTFKEKPFSEFVSTRQPFGFSVLPDCKKSDIYNILLYRRGGTSYCKLSDIKRGEKLLDAHKVLISKAYNGGDTYPHQVIGKPFVAQKKSACSETYLVIGPFANNTECNNVVSYIRTKFFRLLVLLRKSSQNAAQGVYDFVPQQDFSKPWTDEELYAKYGITDEEIAFIDSMIRPMDLGGDTDG